MKTFASLATVAALVGVAAAQSSPTVTTPTSLVECQPAQFTVSGGTAPYFISILPGGETGATPLENLPTQNAAGSVTWNVDIQSGTAITIAVRDSTGALNYSQQVTIQAGTSTSCVGTNSGGGGASASGASSASGGASSASSAASSAPVSSSSRASPSSAASSSAASSSSSSRATSSAPTSSTEAPSSTPAASSSAPSASASNSGAGELLAQTGFLGAVAAFVMAVVA